MLTVNVTVEDLLLFCCNFCCIIISHNGASSQSLLSEYIQWLTAKQPAFNQARLSLNHFEFAFHFAAFFNCLIISRLSSHI